MPKRAFSWVGRRLTYANVMATIAVFLALGGTSYAVTALPRDSVGTPQLQDGSVSVTKIKARAISAAKIAKGAVGQRQLRNRAVTGAKLRDNAVTGAKVRDGSLTAADLAPGVLTGGSPGPAGPQGPAGPAGATGPAGPAGTLDAPGFTRTDLPGGLNTGTGPSLVIGTDGYGLISSTRGFTPQLLQVDHCTNLACTQATRTTAADATVGSASTALVIGADGLGMVFYGTADGALNVARCADVACTALTAQTPELLTGANALGALDAAVGIDGVPVIAWYDATAQDVRLARCADATCQSLQTPQTLAADDDSGSSLVIAIRPSGLPLVAYYHVSASATSSRLVSCTNAACTAFGSPVVIQSAAGQFSNMGLYPDIAILGNGLAMVAYTAGNTAMSIATCTTAACTATDTPIVLMSGNYGAPSVAIGPDALPVIAFYGWSPNFSSHLLRCTAWDCANGEDMVVNLGEPISGFEPSLKIGPDGNPLFAFVDSSDSAVGVVHCGSTVCLPHQRG